LSVSRSLTVQLNSYGWKVFEARRVEPVFFEKDRAIYYAENRTCFRSGEIRILDPNGATERVFPFADTDRNLSAQFVAALSGAVLHPKSH
jgi:hypothetical protein